MKVELRALAPRDALAFFRSKGLAPPDRRFDFRDIWRNEHARAFVVAKAMRTEVLETIRGALDEALAEGGDIRRFTERLEPELKRLGWWGESTERDPLTGELRQVRLGSQRRLQVIFDANMRAAHAAGKWARIERVKDAFPFLRYIQIQRDTKRPEHARYHDLVLPVDHPAWERIYPPNGWRCGCTVQQLSQRQLDRRGLRVTEDFRLEERPVLNRRSGAIEPTALGVDPAWDGNPGKAWLDLSAAHDEVSAGLPRAVAATERGLASQVRIFGLGDGREHLAMLDLATGDEIDFVSGAPDRVRLGAAMRARAREGGPVGLVHNHPSSRPLSLADIEMLTADDAIANIVAVGHDGSLFRAEPLERPAFAIADAAGIAAELVDALSGDALSGGARDHAIRTTLLAALNSAQFIRYRESLGPLARAERAQVADVVRDAARRLSRNMR